MAKIATKSAEGNVVSFTFSNGEVVSLDASALPEEIRQQAMLHGLLQKIGDSYAGAESVEEAVDSAKSMVERLLAGEWKAARKSTGGGTVRTSLLAEALSRALGKDLDTVLEVLSGLSDEQKRELRKRPIVAKEIETIKAERAMRKAEKLAEEGDSEDLAQMFG